MRPDRSSLGECGGERAPVKSYLVGELEVDQICNSQQHARARACVRVDGSKKLVFAPRGDPNLLPIRRQYPLKRPK